MADAVTVRALPTNTGLSKRKNASPHFYYAVHLTNISDANGESAVVKVDKSTLLSADAAEPAKMAIEEILCSIQGFTSVKLLWDHSTDDVAAVLTGNDYRNYSECILVDPASSGGTGDLLLTTVGASATATYDITIVLRLLDN